jgi:phage terminase large subunit-like protein
VVTTQRGLLVTADNTQTVEFVLRPGVKTLGTVVVSESAALLRPGTTQDVYTITPALQRTLAGLNGGTSLDQAYTAITAAPGAFVPAYLALDFKL